MRIVFFMQDTGAVFGAERATLDLATGLRSAGDEPLFFLMEESRFSKRPSALRHAIEQAGFPVRMFPVNGRFSPECARAVKHAFCELQGDVLHVIGYKANLHARMSGVRPVVATVHGWLFRRDPKERLYDAVDRWCLRRCDAVVCLSSYYRDLLLRSGIKPDRLHWIPSGLASLPGEQERDRPVPKRGGAVFGMLGRFSEEKNHELFLDAAAVVVGDYPEARFRIAGQGPLEPWIRERIAELGLADAVTLCGYQPVDAFIASIDVYVICSKIENLPYSILEAMAWSRPVIGTRVGGIPDLVEDGVNGHLTEPGDVAGLAGAMRCFLDQPGHVAAMGPAGRQRVTERFTLEVCARRHQDLYRSLRMVPA